VKHLYIGGYGSGILAPGTGTTPVASPSFLAVHPVLPVLYAVGELESGELTAFSTTGGLTAVASRSSSGHSPCHLAVHPSGTLLAVANYGDGTVSLHRLDDQGLFLGEPVVLTHEGRGPRADRQEGPHAHQCVFHDDVLHVPDLGTDEIRRYTLDGRALAPVRLMSGMGPRHLVFDEYGRCHVAGELDATVRTYDERWREISSVAASGTGVLTYPSHIDLVGGAVYVANRGPDTLSVIRDGRRVAEVPTGGAWPRHFAADGDTLWVANQNSDSVAVFRLKQGLPHPTGETLEVKTPACVLPA
jgi:6-phosphogluconolactonase